MELPTNSPPLNLKCLIQQIKVQKPNCNANPAIGIFVTQGEIIYHGQKFTSQPTLVVELHKRLYDRDGSYKIIGVVRRDFSLYDDEIDTIFNRMPSIRSIITANYVGEGSTSIYIEVEDYLTKGQTLGDSVTMTWSHNLPNCTVKFDSNQKHPTLRIIWNPTNDDIRKNADSVHIWLKDNACPRVGFYSTTIPVYAESKPTGNLMVRPFGCGKYEMEYFLDSFHQGFMKGKISIKNIQKTGLKYFEKYHKYHSGRTSYSDRHIDTVEVFESGHYKFELYVLDRLRINFVLADTGIGIEHPEFTFNQSFTGLCKYKLKDIPVEVYAQNRPLKYSWRFSNEVLLQTDSFPYYSPDYFYRHTDTMTVSGLITDDKGYKVEFEQLFHFCGLEEPNIGQDTTFCKVDYTLTAQSFKEYSRNTGDTTQSIHVNKPGLYSVTVSDICRCRQSDSVYSGFAGIKQRPWLTLIDDTLYCNFNEPRYIWYRYEVFEHLSDTNHFKPNKTGVYQVQVRSPFGCKSELSDRLFVGTVGIQLKRQPQFNIFPNPSEGHFQIVFGNPGEYRLEVLNVTGQSIQRTEKKFLSKADIHIEKEGLFLIKVINGDGSVMHKIVQVK